MAVQAHWLIQPASQLPPHDRWLTHGETTVLAGLRVPKRRADWRLGRWTAKRAVVAHSALQDSATALRDADVEIKAAADGAPEPFVGGRALPLTISLSHCQDLGLCTVAAGACQLGCDIEAIESRHDRFIADYFTESEQRWVRDLADAHQPLATTLLWSAKEAALKAQRTGLRRDTRSVAVGPCDLAAARNWSPLTLRDAETDLQLQGWWRLMRSAFVVTVAGVGLAEPPAALFAASLEVTAASGPDS